MMGALKDLIIGLRYMSLYLISIDDYLQTFKEFKEVQNSLNFVKGIERLPVHRSSQDFFLSSKGVKN
jgi:hypothetical protein